MIDYAQKLLVQSVLIIVFSFVSSSANEPKAEGMLLPTDVLYLSFKSMAENPTMGRKNQVGAYFGRVQTENLDEVQKFALAEVYYVNLKPTEALTAFEPFMDGDDLRARIAWQRVMQIRFRAYNEPERVEEMVNEYRAKFEPNRIDVWGVEGQIVNIAGKYQRAGNYQKVVDLIREELARLPHNTPYMVFRAPGQFMKSFQETGNIELAEKMITEIHNDLKNVAANYIKTHPEGSMFYKAADYVPGRVYRMEEGLLGAVFEENYPTSELRFNQFDLVINELNGTLRRLRVEK